MAAQPVSILTLRGGQNDTDPANMLRDDECVLAENVEFYLSALGERRNGCGALDITSSDLDDEATIGHISQWFPTNDVTVPEFWALGVTATTSTTLAKRTAGTWSEVVPTDAIGLTVPDVYNVATQALNGKFYFAYHSGQDRMHVWDGTTLRRTGLAIPAAPTAANEGGGTYASVRYFRIRYQIKSGSTVVAQSEPSPSVTFTPSGAGAGARITKPASISEGETHWVVEGAEDNATFYVLTTLAVGTTTYDDTVVYATGYNASGPLSEDTGEYLNLPSAKFLAVDGDRLVFASHWTDLTKQSQVGWTPVFNDPGVANDERLPLSVNNTVNLDNYAGGGITGIAASTSGTWFVFKWSRLYKMVRTGDVSRAYDVITLSTTNGAVPGSIVPGVDESGASCVFYLDPQHGPSRVGPSGIQFIRGLRTTWRRVNLQANSVVARGCYYAAKQQVHWWVAVDGNDLPSLKMVLQVSEIQAVSADSVGRGWSTWTGRITQATAVGVLTELVSIGGITSLSDRPFVGLTSPDYIQRCDTESTDAGTTYKATIRTKPFILTGLLNRWGAMTASLLATAHASATLIVKMLRDFSVETNQITTGLAPVGSETLVIKDFDDLRMSGSRTIQLEFTDV